MEATELSSWIAGFPIPILLLARRPVTVDLAPPFLKEPERFYGLPEEALIALARAQLIFFNIRDCDPSKTELASGAQKYEEFRPFIERLLNEVPHSTYFLAAIRPRIFDAVPRMAKFMNRSIEDIYSGVFQDLTHVDQLARRQADENLQIGAGVNLFRGELPAPAAVAWHFGYALSMAAVMDYDQLAKIQNLIKVITSSIESEAKIRAYNAIVPLLRYSHLLASAPLSASFGGLYNIDMDLELPFMLRVESSAKAYAEHDFVNDDYLDFMSALILGYLPIRDHVVIDPYLKDMPLNFGVETFVKTVGDPFFQYYSKDYNINILIEYCKNTDISEEHRSNYSLYKDFKDALSVNNPEQSRSGESRDRIGRIAALYYEGSVNRDNHINKGLKGFIRFFPRGTVKCLTDPNYFSSLDPKVSSLYYRMLGCGIGSNAGSNIGAAGDFERRIHRWKKK